jgi:signal transduction histidine kinase
MEDHSRPLVVNQGASAAAEESASARLLELVEALRLVGVFNALPNEDLVWFVQNTEEQRYSPGEIIFHKGAPADWMSVYLEGEAQAFRDDNLLDGFVYIARAGDPATEVSGRLPYSRMTEFPATTRAVTDVRLLLFPASLFPELLHRNALLGQRLVGLMSDRVRESTKAEQQRDKLLGLGKLSAGLAHELNNPAAAASRAADDLIVALEDLRAADLRLCQHGLSGERRQFLAELEKKAIVRHQEAAPLDALAQSDREDEINRWLNRHDITEGWEIAATIAEAGVPDKSLEELLQKIGPEAFGDVLQRLTAQLTAAKLVFDIKASTTRISELVGAIKEYSYMDQASVQEVDLHRGLDNTLLILKHKLKKKSIVVVREYAEGLPTVTAFGSELNQVWTNLIDNAIDAMQEGGRLKVRTKIEPTDVMVEIRDNGPGIPQEIQSRIFEPFFTTKPVGQGTGLGLDAVSRIVRRHRANIRFETRPGDTCFQVRLPISRVEKPQ